MNLQLTTYDLRPEKKKKRNAFWIIVVCCLLFVVCSTIALAAPPTTTTPTTPAALPTTCVEVPLPKFLQGNLPDPCSSPAAYIQYWFYFGLYLGGFVALLALVGAGVYRVVAAHNPVSVRKADSYIVNAVLGLILLFGSWLLLHTLGGSGLTKVQDPILPQLPPINSSVVLSGKAGEACIFSPSPTQIGPTLQGSCSNGFSCVSGICKRTGCESVACTTFTASTPAECKMNTLKGTDGQACCKPVTNTNGQITGCTYN